MEQLSLIPTLPRTANQRMRVKPQTLFGTAREQGGKSAKHAGKAFEALILASQQDAQGPVCVLQQVKSFARWLPERRPEFIKLGQRMQLMQEPSPFDFAGSVYGTGVGVFFDAKSIGPDTASLAVNNPKIVKPHQINALAALEAAEAFAGFLVRAERVGMYLWLWGSRARRDKPIRFDDPAWDVLGPIDWQRPVPLRKLFNAYE